MFVNEIHYGDIEKQKEKLLANTTHSYVSSLGYCLLDKIGDSIQYKKGEEVLVYLRPELSNKYNLLQTKKSSDGIIADNLPDDTLRDDEVLEFLFKYTINPRIKNNKN